MRKLLLSLMGLVFVLGAQAQTLSGYYTESFESPQFPPTGWRTVNVLGSEVWTRSSNESYDGGFSAYMEYQGSGGEDWLIMPKFTVTAGDSISFWMMPDFTGFPPDSLIIRISTTDSALASFTTRLLVLEEGVNYPSIAFERFAASLNAFAGQNIWVAFSHYNEDGDGIYVDKVSIGTPPPVDGLIASTNWANYPKSGNYTPTASILNQGTQNATGKVYMQISNGYLDSANVNVNSNATANATFSLFTAPAPGTYTVKTYVKLTGDASISNDTLTETIEVIPTFTNFGWSSQTPVPVSHFGAASTFYQGCNTANDSAFIFFAGGSTLSGTTDTVLRYNVVSKVWSPVASMPINRYQFPLIAANGKIYAIGGYTSGFTPTTRVDSYDPATNTWTQMTSLPVSLGDMAAASYGDSLIYVVSGYDGSADRNVVYVYNTRLNTWNAATNFTGIAGGGIRMGIAKNKIVITGGYNQVAAVTNAQTLIGTISLTNPTSITWSNGPVYPGGTHSRHAAGTVWLKNDAKVYFTGGDATGEGTSALDKTYAFDVDQNRWFGGPAKITQVSNVYNMTQVVRNDSVFLAVLAGYDGANLVNTHEWIALGPILPAGVVWADTTVCSAGSFNLDAFGGLSYAWTPSAGLSNANIEDPTANVTAPTTYYVNINQGFGCPVTDSISININPAISLSMSPSAATSGNCDGQIIAAANGGAGSFTYSWNDPNTQNTATATGLCGPAYYTVTVTDANGCTATDSAQVTVTVSINENDNWVLSAYPNPTNNWVSIQLNETPNSPVAIRVMDISGRVIQTQFVQSSLITVDLTSQANGIYIVELTQGTHRNSVRVIKNK